MKSPLEALETRRAETRAATVATYRDLLGKPTITAAETVRLEAAAAALGKTPDDVAADATVLAKATSLATTAGDAAVAAEAWRKASGAERAAKNDMDVAERKWRQARTHLAAADVAHRRAASAAADLAILHETHVDLFERI